MKTALICWLGMTDIRCSLGTEPRLGPIGQAAKERSYDSVELISNSSKQEGATYVAWLRERTKSQINLHQVKLSSPMNYGEIYERADDIVSGLLQKEPRSLVFHLSPGTSAMAAMWLVLATTKYPAELIASSKEESVYSTLSFSTRHRRSQHGMRSGPLRDRVLGLIPQVAFTDESTGRFLWYPNAPLETTDYRHPANEDARRPVDEISFSELCDFVMTHRSVLNESDPPLAIARLLGISRLKGGSRDRIHEAISRAKDFFGESDRIQSAVSDSPASSP